MLDYIQATVPVIALTLNVAVQLMVARACRQGGLVRSIAAGFGAGLAGLLALGACVAILQGGPWHDRAAILLVNVGAYVALSFCFFAFLNLGVTSIRIRLFSELLHSRHGLSMEQVLSLYDYRKIIELRLERLLKRGQVIKRDGRYFLDSFVLWSIAAVVRSAKILVIGKSSEFQGGAVAPLLGTGGDPQGRGAHAPAHDRRLPDADRPIGCGPSAPAGER
jgi:hypothetical protein